MSFENPGDGKRCDHCNRPGESYEYKDRTFSGLCPTEEGKLCPTCRDHYLYRKINEPVGPLQIPAHEYVTPIAAAYRNRDYQRPRRRPAK